MATRCSLYLRQLTTNKCQVQGDKKERWFAMQGCVAPAFHPCGSWQLRQSSPCCNNVPQLYKVEQDEGNLSLRLSIMQWRVIGSISLQTMKGTSVFTLQHNCPRITSAKHCLHSPCKILPLAPFQKDLKALSMKNNFFSNAREWIDGKTKGREQVS